MTPEQKTAVENGLVEVGKLAVGFFPGGGIVTAIPGAIEFAIQAYETFSNAKPDNVSDDEFLAELKSRIQTRDIDAETGGSDLDLKSALASVNLSDA